MKMSKSKIAVLAVICYIAFVCWSIIEYNTYVTNIIAEYEELGISRGYIDPWGYTHFWHAKTAVITGIALIFGAYVVLSRLRKKENKKAIGKE